MKYDLKNIVDINRAKDYFETLIARKVLIELKQRRKPRTYLQNRYLHLLLGYIALETGHSLPYIKENVFKILLSPDIFKPEERIGKLGVEKTTRSSAKLDSKEMTTAIDRFIDWAKDELNIQLPKPHEKEYIAQLEAELEHQKEWVKQY
jgi:hypothetical protein